MFSALFSFWFPDLPSLCFVFPCFILLSLALLFSGAGTDADKNLEGQSSMPGGAIFFSLGLHVLKYLTEDRASRSFAKTGLF